MKENTLYRHILKDALKIVWNNKTLWVLGFLAIFWGDLGAYQSLDRVLGDFGPKIAPLTVQKPLLPSAEMFTPGGFALLLGLTLLVLAIIVGLIVLVTSARGGIIWAIAARRERKSVPLKEALKKGARSFWPLLGIGVLTRLDALLYVWILSPLVKGGGNSSDLAFYILAFIAATLVSVVLSFLGVYAAAFIMIEGASFIESIKESLRLFARNWLISLELGLILYLITFFIGAAVIAVLLALGIPFLLLGVIAALTGSEIGVWTALIVLAFIYIAFLLVAGSAFITFQYSAWTLLYLRLRKQGALAKVVRLTSRFSNVLHRRIV